MTARLGVWLAVAAALMATPLAAKAPPPPTAAEKATMLRALERGGLIYAYDQAAWHSTDEMLRRMPGAKFPAKGSWVVLPRDGGVLRVIYYGLEDGTAPQALFQADMRGSSVVESHVFAEGEDRTLPREALALVAARSVAMERGKANRPCTEGNFNIVVLPPGKAGDPTPVYLLSPMVTTGEYPFGGHYEIDVGEGGKVSAERGFTRACLTMSLDAPGPDGKAAEAAVVSHLLDPAPTEIHVFMALWLGRPVYVITGPERIWQVTGDHIRLMDAP